jgi:hypothetical protein
MTEEQLLMLREWVRAEVVAGVADREMDSCGYVLIAHDQHKAADHLFSKLCDLLEKKHGN